MVDDDTAVGVLDDAHGPQCPRATEVHLPKHDHVPAVITTIGGDDRIRVLPHLDRDLIPAHPKPFFGYSDNTHLLLWLWNTGIVGYYGSSVMYHLGRPMSLHPLSMGSLRAALFTSGEYTLPEPTESGDVDLPWSDPATFERERPLERAAP